MRTGILLLVVLLSVIPFCGGEEEEEVIFVVMMKRPSLLHNFVTDMELFTTTREKGLGLAHLVPDQY